MGKSYNCLPTSLYNESVQNVNPRSDVLNQPVETVEEAISCVRAAAHNLPMSISVHAIQIQNLKASV
jgi:hypothetical protein